MSAIESLSPEQSGSKPIEEEEKIDKSETTILQWVFNVNKQCKAFTRALGRIFAVKLSNGIAQPPGK